MTWATAEACWQGFPLRLSYAMVGPMLRQPPAWDWRYLSMSILVAFDIRGVADYSYLGICVALSPTWVTFIMRKIPNFQLQFCLIIPTYFEESQPLCNVV